MRKIFVIGCTHFGDSRILEYKDNRGELIRPGFDNIREMDECLMDNWNSVVGPQDIVYHLGDVYAGHTSVLDKLNGRKRLVLGNHDNGKDINLWNTFQKISSSRMWPEFDVILTHIPVIIPLMAKYSFNVHAHLHQNDPPSLNHINVSAERVNFTPVELEPLLIDCKQQVIKITQKETLNVQNAKSVRQRGVGSGAYSIRETR